MNSDAAGDGSESRPYESCKGSCLAAAFVRLAFPAGIMPNVDASGKVVEIQGRRNGWYDFADGIRSELLIGTVGDRILETAAGFGIMLIITGLYLWWPLKGSALGTLVPDLLKSGRALWKTLHGTVGVYLFALLLLFLIFGMSWTGVWGGKLVQAWCTCPAKK